MGFIYMKDKDGQVITVNENSIGKYEGEGYTRDLNKPLDQSKLSDNSVFKTGNKNNIGSGYVMPNTTTGVTDKIAKKSNIVQNTQPNSQTDLMQQLADAQNSKALAGLKNAYDKNINEITAQEKLINPAYESQRSGLRADSTMQAKDFENFLANKGILASGTAGQGEIARNVSLQGGLSNSQLQQRKALEDIAQMKLEERQNYNSGIVSSSADIEAQLLRNKLEENQRMADIERDNTRYKEDVERSAAADERNKFISTLSRFAANYQAEINKVKNDGDTSNDWQIPILEAARQEKISSQGLDQQGNKIPIAPTQMSYDQALTLWKTYGVATSDIAEALNVPVGAKTEDYIGTQYDVNKPYYAPAKTTSGGSSSSSSGSTPWYLK
jgi:hypothetical protein